MRDVAEWDERDGWDKVERAIDVGSKWALVMAVTALGIRALYQFLTGN